MANCSTPSGKRGKILVIALIIAATFVAFYAFSPQKEKGPVVELTDATFRERISTGVYLVDFWATWCGPCKDQAPIVEEVAGQFRGRAAVAKVDVDRNEKIAEEFKIEAIPTLIVFKDGKEVRRFVGLEDAETLAKARTGALQ